MHEAPKLPLRLEVLGPPRFRDARGAEKELRATKFHALVVYLACQQGSVTRTHLEQLFWPGSDKAAHSLRQSLSRLRGLLGEAVETSGDRVGLVSDLVQVEAAPPDSMRSAAQADAFCTHVRGSFCEGFDFSYSSELQAWYDARERALFDLVTTAARSIVFDLWARGRSETADRVIAAALGVGLSRSAFMASLGAEAVTKVVRGGEGVAALEDFVTQGLERDDVALGFVVGPTDELLGIASGALERLESPPPTIELGHDAERRPAAILADLLGRLARLPGGAGQSPETEALAEDLRREPEVGLGPGGARGAGRALEDAFAAVLDEGPLVLLVAMHHLPSLVTEALAVSLQGGPLPGLVVVLHAPDAGGMMGPAGPALIQGRTDYAQIVLGEVPEADAVEWETWLDSSIDAIASPRVWRSAFAIAGIALVLLVAGWASLRGATGRNPMPDFDFVVCVQHGRGESHHLEVFDARSGRFQVLPGSESDGCPANRLNGGQDGVFLATATRRATPSGGFAAGNLLRFSRVSGAGTDSDWRVDTISNPDGYQVIQSTQGWAPGGEARYAARLRDEIGQEYVARIDVDTRGSVRVNAEDVIAVDDAASVPLGLNREGTRVFWRTRGPRFFDAAGARWDASWPATEVLASDETDFLPIDWVGDTVWVERGLTGEAEDGSLEVGYVLAGRPETFVRLTDNTWNDLEFRLSPDRKRACWKNERRGHYQSNIVWLDRETGEEFELDREGRQTSCFWAPDSQGLFFREYQGDFIQLFYLKIGWDQPRAVIRESVYSTLVGPLPAPTSG
jgi:hypothetical protein